MSPDRAAALVARWVRLYTRRLPPHIGDRRIEEMGSDLRDHIAFERARGAPERAIALSIVSRMVRGVPADVAWRQHVHPVEGDFMKPLVGLLLAAIGIAVVALVLDAPILILLSIVGIGMATLGAFVLSVQAAQQRNVVVPLVAILAGSLAVTALGVVAIILGDRGDAPGLVLFGVALITSVVVGALAFGMRTAQRSSR